MKENFYLSLDNIKSPENMVFSGLKKFSSVKNIFSEFYLRINFILLLIPEPVPSSAFSSAGAILCSCRF